jgi:hypothetical protein
LEGWKRWTTLSGSSSMAGRHESFVCSGSCQRNGGTPIVPLLCYWFGERLRSCVSNQEWLSFEAIQCSGKPNTLIVILFAATYFLVNEIYELIYCTGF